MGREWRVAVHEGIQILNRIMKLIIKMRIDDTIHAILIGLVEKMKELVVIVVPAHIIGDNQGVFCK